MRRTKRGGWPYSQPPNVPFTLNKDSPQAKGLVAWWPTLASRGANILRDLSGYGHDGTLENGTAWELLPVLGQALLFAGDDDYIAVGTPPALNNLAQGAFSAAFWHRYILNDAALRRIWFKRSPGNGWSIYLSRSTTQRLWVAVEGAVADGISETVSGEIPQNELYHVVVTYDDNGDRLSRIYINGYEVSAYQTQTATNGVVGDDSGVNLNIGGRVGNEPLERNLVDCRIYNCVLTDAEAYTLYARGTRWELYKPLVPWILALSPITVRIPRYGFTNFQVPGIV